MAAGDYIATTSELKDFCGEQIDSCVVANDEEQSRGEALNTRKNRDMIIGLTLGGAGGAMLVAAIVGGVMARSDDTSEPASVGFAVSPTGLATSMTLSF